MPQIDTDEIPCHPSEHMRTTSSQADDDIVVVLRHLYAGLTLLDGLPAEASRRIVLAGPRLHHVIEALEIAHGRSFGACRDGMVELG